MRIVVLDSKHAKGAEMKRSEMHSGMIPCPTCGRSAKALRHWGLYEAVCSDKNCPTFTEGDYKTRQAAKDAWNAGKLVNPYEVEYWTATYHGTVTVYAEDEKDAKAIATKRLAKSVFMPRGEHLRLEVKKEQP